MLGVVGVFGVVEVCGVGFLVCFGKLLEWVVGVGVWVYRVGSWGVMC